MCFFYHNRTCVREAISLEDIGTRLESKTSSNRFIISYIKIDPKGIKKKERERERKKLCRRVVVRSRSTVRISIRRTIQLKEERR